MAKTKALRLWERDGKRVYAGGVREAVRLTGGWRGETSVKVREVASGKTYQARRDELGQIKMEVL